MSRSKALFAGLMAGLIAGIAMTTVMLLLACFGVATPLAIIGDRLSVFIPPGPFLALMGKVGDYNHLKQFGVGSTMAGQLVVGALAGAPLLQAASASSWQAGASRCCVNCIPSRRSATTAPNTKAASSNRSPRTNCSIA